MTISAADRKATQRLTSQDATWFNPVAFFVRGHGSLASLLAFVSFVCGWYVTGTMVVCAQSPDLPVAEVSQSDAPAQPTLLTFRGATMGTTYMVKVSDPPPASDWATETRMSIERELRAVNDQMSTYLKSSEISRFNDSDQTDWFPVSAEFAEVVAFALQVAEATDGAFDVTVGPLVDRWSFGPSRRDHSVPSDEELEQIRGRIGYQHLSVRTDPPALRKGIPDLRVDLSAIAKGHGVDRVVALLKSLGESDVFVEIGGEVRVSGSKRTLTGPQEWKVGVQSPDSAANELVLAHPMRDEAMATSGDYRNFFEVDGVRYSHTIDPRTLRPVDHSLASVTVIAKNCMAADAWATAINVVGHEQGIRLAKENDLDTLLIHRGDQPTEVSSLKSEKMNMQISGTGSLASIADQIQSNLAIAQTAAGDGGTFGERMAPVLVLTGIAFGAVLIAMGVGVIFGRKSISGSCGGLNATTDPDGTKRCSMCSTPSEGCEQIREKMSQKG